MSSGDFACVLDLDVSYPISMEQRYDEEWRWSQDELKQLYEYIHERRKEDPHYLSELFEIAPANQCFDKFLAAYELYREYDGKWFYKMTDIGNEKPLSYNFGNQYMRVNNFLSGLSVIFKNKLFILRGMYRNNIGTWNSSKIWYNVYFNGEYQEYMAKIVVPKFDMTHLLKDKN